MQTEIEVKLDKIANVWNYFIFKYKFCSDKIKFDDEAKTNYFGDILSYFQDTFDIILNFEKTSNKTFTESFSRNISLLQSIYVNQDFIAEFLILFRCGLTKGDLNKDSNYSINRGIRNELIGHPISRDKSGNLISSTSFGYNAKVNETIIYLKYHSENNFESEVKEYDISEIIKRHLDFLNTYFDMILIKLQIILNSFSKELFKIQKLILSKKIEPTISYVDKIYNAILKENYLFEKENLLKVHQRREEHLRYENHINYFIKELTVYINDTLRLINEIFTPIIEEENVTTDDYLEKPLSFILNETIDISKSELKDKKVSYHNELGKLSTREYIFEMEFSLERLKKAFSNNKTILDELLFLEENIYNELEYHCSLNLIRYYLNELD